MNVLNWIQLSVLPLLCVHLVGVDHAFSMQYCIHWSSCVLWSV